MRPIRTGRPQLVVLWETRARETLVFVAMGPVYAPVARVEMTRYPSSFTQPRGGHAAPGFTMGRSLPLLAALAALTAPEGLGCGGPVCAEGACAQGVCQLDGTCRPLSSETPFGPVRDLHLHATAFGATRRDHRKASNSRQDAAALGGNAGAAMYLMFQIPSGQIERAVLVISPAETMAGASAQSLRVSSTTAFDGDDLTHRNRPGLRRIGPQRTLSFVADRPLRFDVRPLLTESPAPVYLVIEATPEPSGNPVPWRIATPLALDVDRRPVLELQLRTPRRAQSRRE